MRFAEMIRIESAPHACSNGRGAREVLGVLGMRSVISALVVLIIAGLSACASVDLTPQKPPAATAAANAKGSAAAADAAAKAAAPGADAVNPAAQAAFDKARAALAAGRTEEAERAFLAMTRTFPDLAGPHANLALIHRQQGKLADAVAELEQALHTSPNQPVYYNQLGITYREMGQFVKAREAYDKAISLDPNYASAYLNLGILYDVYFWDSKRALELYDRYLALTPAGDDKVKKWVADIKNRAPKQNVLSRKEQP